jgi:hypothetical protein
VIAAKRPIGQRGQVWWTDGSRVYNRHLAKSSGACRLVVRATAPLARRASTGTPPMTSDSTLRHLDRLVGTWTTEATHPAVPGVVVHGSADVEWLEGERFLILRTRTDHPDFTDAISIIGNTEHGRADPSTGTAPAAAGATRLEMHYYDSRGVFRLYQTSIDATAWRFWRDELGFSQRFVGTFVDGGDTISGQAQLNQDDLHWVDDLAITYRRRS